MTEDVCTGSARKEVRLDLAGTRLHELTLKSELAYWTEVFQLTRAGRAGQTVPLN